MGEQAKVAVRNCRRDGNKHVDQLEKDKSSGVTEDAAKQAKHDVDELTKKYEHMIEESVNSKTKEIIEI